MKIAMLQGQAVEWDETVIDSVIPPASLADSSAEFRNLCIRKQTASYHMKVTIPDSTVPHFKYERTTSQYAQRDTISGVKVYKEIIYDDDVSEYDQNDNLIRSSTLPGGIGDEDLTDMPFFDYRPDTVVTDSIRQVFVDSLTALGATVTDLGSSGYSVSMNFTENGQMWTTLGIFEKSYLTPTSFNSNGDGTSTNIAFTYTVIGTHRICTKRVTSSTSTLPAYQQSYYATNAPYVASDFYTTTTVTTVQLSNISLP